MTETTPPTASAPALPPAPPPAPPPETPAARVARAIQKHLPALPHALPEVAARDVLDLVASVPDNRQTEITLALAQGAADAVAGLVPHRAAKVKVHCQAGDLKALLEAAGVNAQ